MDDSIKVNIGIPAYNEGANIFSLLRQVFEQEEAGYVLNKVIVISDGSSDNTVSETEKISDSRLLLVGHTDRKGKGVRFQELLQLSDADVLIQFDADVRLGSTHVVADLAGAIAGGADLAFAKTTPLAPRTYFEELSYAGVYAWEEVLGQMDEELTILHRCQGRCRAFSKRFYKSFVLPVSAASVEDAYSFCFAITQGFKPVYVPDAEVWYRLPSTRKDFIKQAHRYVKGSKQLSQFYGDELVEKYMPSGRLKVRAMLTSFYKFPPHIILGYVLLQMYARKTATMEQQKPVYDYVGSTKKLE